MHLSKGSARDVVSLTELINSACRDKRNFVPVTERDLHAIWSRDASFGDEGLLLARDEAGRLIGATHALYDALTRRGYLPFLLAREGYEAAVWPQLLAASERHLATAASVRIGSPYTPLYHALEGRFQPLWGTTEVMEPADTDVGLTSFLGQRGFRVHRTHLAMTHNLSPMPAVDNPLPLSRCEHLQGAECWSNSYAWYGQMASEEFGLYNHELNVFLVREGYRVIGHIAWYPMKQVGKVAISDLAVTRQLRGKGIGTYLLRWALVHLHLRGFTTAELCTTPKLSAAANRLYRRTGFVPTERWLEMILTTRNVPSGMGSSEKLFT